MQAANEFAAVGADAVMLLTPYYTRPTQDGIRDYYLRFADESPLPVLIYEIPYRTQVTTRPDKLHVVTRHERSIGMKDRKSVVEGTRVGVRVDSGGGRHKKKKQ